MSVHAGSGKQGSQDGLGTSARLNYPFGIAIDQQTDTIYVSNLHSIRKMTLQGMSMSCDHEWWNRCVFFCVDVYMLLILIPQCSYHVIIGRVSTLAGSAAEGDANGNGNRARFNVPMGLWFDEKHQSLLVCDYLNDKLKRVSLKGMLNIAISFFSARHLHHTSSSFHLILSSSSSWLILNNRRCNDSVWHTSSNLCDNSKHNYSRLNLLWQNLSSHWSRYFHSPPSFFASLHLSLSVSTSILLTHRSLTHPTFQGKRVYFNSILKVERRRNASSTTTTWVALYWMRRPTLVSL